MKTFATAIGALALASAANAGVLYDNGAPNYASGNEMTAWTQAEDFNLAVSGDVASVNFSLLDLNNNGLGAFDGSMQWRIYSDAAGSPGALLDSGSANNITTVFDTNNGSWDFYNASFDLNADGSGRFSATGGVTYWIGLHVNSDWLTRDDLYWGTSDANASSTGHEAALDVPPWNDNGNQHSFSLKGEIPAPGAFALLGLAGLASRRRRR